jgi:hypothetical protein
MRVNVSSLGLTILQRAQGQASASGAGVVQASLGPPGGANLVAQVAGLQQAGTDVAVGAAVVETGQKLTRTLLDLFA